MLAFATIATNAQETAAPTWTTDLITTEAASDLRRGGAMAIDNSGNAIVTGSFTKDVEFASSYLEPIATSAFIAKYDKAGKNLWAASLKGAATIKSVTTDAKGNIYAAGVFADEVQIVNKAGETKTTIKGKEGETSQVSAFIVKFTKDGEYAASNTIIPVVDMVHDCYLMADTHFTPGTIKMCGDKVIMSAEYTGKNEIGSLTLKGQYCYKPDWFYMYDIPTLGIISLSDDLSEATLVAQLAATQAETNEGYCAEECNFTTDGTKIYAGFVAYGTDLTLKAANNSKQITDLLTATKEDEIQYEQAFILATIENGSIINTMTYHSQIDDDMPLAKFNTIDEMQYLNGNIYLAGTFNEAFPFDNSKTFVGGCDTYAVSLKASDLSKNWALTSGFDEGDAKKKAENVTGMAVLDDEVQITAWSGSTATYEVETPINILINTESTPSAMIMHTGDNAFFATSVANNGIYHIIQSDNRTMLAEDKEVNGKYTYKFFNDDDDDTSVDQIAASGNAISWNGQTVTLAKSADVNIYNAGGSLILSAKNASSVSLADAASGVYVVKTGNQTFKIEK